jgi:hypothetical protein
LIVRYIVPLACQYILMALYFPLNDCEVAFELVHTLQNLLLMGLQKSHTLRDHGISLPSQFCEGLHLTNGHACGAQTAKKGDPFEITGGIAAMATASTVHGLKQPYLLVIAERMDRQTGTCRNFLNRKFFFHVSSIQVRAHSKSRGLRANLQILRKEGVVVSRECG